MDLAVLAGDGDTVDGTHNLNSVVSRWFLSVRKLQHQSGQTPDEVRGSDFPSMFRCFGVTNRGHPPAG